MGELTRAIGRLDLSDMAEPADSPEDREAAERFKRQMQGRAPSTKSAPAPSAAAGPASSAAATATARLAKAAARANRPAPRRVNDEDLPRAAAPRLGMLSVFFGLIGFSVRIALATVIIVGLAGLGGFYAVQTYVRTDEVTVPSVRGMRVEEAFESLSDKGLALMKERTEASALVAPGEIIDQRPGSGIKTKRGATIRVVISSGRASFVVPNVVGESKEGAINKIKGARLEVGDLLYLEDEVVPKDHVISQTPEANKGLDKAQKVDLALSGGPRNSGTVMPSVTGISLSDARAKLQAAGISEVLSEPADASPQSEVTSQEPPAGSTVTGASRIVLRASRLP